MLRASDIQRAALLMVTRHGPEAARRAEKRVADLAPVEPCAADSWRLVATEIRTIQVGA